MPRKANKAAASTSNPSERFGRKPRWMSGMAAAITRSKMLEHRKSSAK